MTTEPTLDDIETIDLATFKFRLSRHLAKHAVIARDSGQTQSALAKLSQARNTEALLWRRFPQGPEPGE